VLERIASTLQQLVAAQGQSQQQQQVLASIATALQQLVAAQGQSQQLQQQQLPQGQAGGQMAAPEQQVQADGQIQAPASLQPLLTLALAAQGQQDGASAVLLALGYPEGHPHRSQIFAALNGVLAVCAPQVHLAGLSMVRPVPGTAARARLLRFVEEHMSVFQQAVMRQGALPTIVSCVARGLRCDALLRERHGARFLEQVGDMYSQLRPGAASGSSAGGSLPEAGNAGGGEGAAGGRAQG
jgi:hypothetical protein